MVPPGAGDLVKHRLQRVGVVGDQLERKVRHGEGVHQCQEGKRHQAEAGDSRHAGPAAIALQAEDRLRQRGAQRQKGREVPGFDHPPIASGRSSRGW